MEQYIATFHTHLAALRTHRALGLLGISARMMPVPRRLSSSCGTCVWYEAEGDQRTHMDADAQCIYRIEGEENYAVLVQYD